MTRKQTAKVFELIQQGWRAVPDRISRGGSVRLQHADAKQDDIRVNPDATVEIVKSDDGIVK